MQQANNKKWVIVAGHRRIAAMRRAGFESFYAIISTADDRQAFYMQLAENIHRTQLSTREVADPVRGLFDEHKTEFSKVAREMLLNSEFENLETLGTINQLDKLVAYKAIEALQAEPPVTRAKVKAALKSQAINLAKEVSNFKLPLEDERHVA